MQFVKKIYIYIPQNPQSGVHFIIATGPQTEYSLPKNCRQLAIWPLKPSFWLCTPDKESIKGPATYDIHLMPTSTTTKHLLRKE